jgi:hypothetical protein
VLAGRFADIEALDTGSELCDILGEAIYDKCSNKKYLRLNSGFVVVFRSAHPSPAGPTPRVTEWKKTMRMMTKDRFLPIRGGASRRSIQEIEAAPR